ncbi:MULTISPECIES: hypothetical protein [unclassified Agarivorans]|uniref:aldose epimerase family protein n=1 Tax=unclassified Agarivorans TaxID=2636026 RepID=UPI003D7ED9F5
MLQDINYANCTLSIDSRGGYALRFLVNKQHILMPALEGAGCGGLFPMAPIANRVTGNTIPWHGQNLSLPNVEWDELFFLHGDAWKKPWRVLNKNKSTIQLVLESHMSPQIDYLAMLSYQLSESSLAVTLRVTNQSANAFPFNIGLHPFFSANDKTELCLLHQGYWPEGEHHLPMAYQERVATQYDFRTKKALLKGWLNHCYRVSTPATTLFRPDLGYRIVITYNTHYITLYQPSISDGYICIEPQAYPIDAHHQIIMPEIEPKACQEVKMTIKVLPL